MYYARYIIKKNMSRRKVSESLALQSYDQTVMSRVHKVLVNIMTKFYPFHNFLRVSSLSTGQSGYKNCAMPSCTSFYAHKTALQVTGFNWPVEKTHRHQKVDTEMLKTKKRRQNDGEKQCEPQLGGGRRWGGVLNNIYYG